MCISICLSFYQQLDNVWEGGAEGHKTADGWFMNRHTGALDAWRGFMPSYTSTANLAMAGLNLHARGLYESGYLLYY
jgi:hypothetical protein